MLLNKTKITKNADKHIRGLHFPCGAAKIPNGCSKGTPCGNVRASGIVCIPRHGFFPGFQGWKNRSEIF